MRRVLVASLIVGLVLIAAGGIGWGTHWALQSWTKRECFTVESVDTGQGFDHVPTVYTTKGDFSPHDSPLGEWLALVHTSGCWNVEDSNGAVRPWLPTTKQAAS